MTTIPAMRQRVQSIDVLRGIVMVLMALDHTRDFFHKAITTSDLSMATDPTNLDTTTPFLFFTRWITHFCAPTFVFLAGTSAYLMSRKKSIAELRSFMVKRGLWLILVEVLIISFSWTFNPLYSVLFLQVIWAIGISMIILGLLIFLPVNAIVLIGLVITLGHNLLDMPTIANSLKGHFFSDLLFDAAFTYYNYAPGHGIVIVYAFLQWTGLMFMGYGLGQLYVPGYDAVKRQKLLLQLGTGILIFFVLLRFSNLYGDPYPWGIHPRGPVFSFLSFLNVYKYPPSLLYSSMRIWTALIVLSVLEKYSNRITGFFNQFGRVPMFYYIAHFYLLKITAVIVFFLSGYTSKDIVGENNPFFFLPEGFGFSLAGVYLLWICLILVLYPLCKKYNAYKSTHQQWWLSYL
jgi:uncharacterized membrane protein